MGDADPDIALKKMLSRHSVIPLTFFVFVPLRTLRGATRNSSLHAGRTGRRGLEENALSRAEEVSYGLYGVNALPEHRGAHAPVLLLRILDTARPVKPYSVLAKTTTK